MVDRHYPEWCCEECGKPLRIEPCLNCQQKADRRSKSALA